MRICTCACGHERLCAALMAALTSEARVALDQVCDLLEVLLLEVRLVEACEVAHPLHDLVVKVAARPVPPQLDHLGLVVVLLREVPGVDREVELGGPGVLELVLVEDPEVGAHQRLPRVLPTWLVEDHLAGAREVALVPVQQLLFETLIIEALALVPGPLCHRHVRGREGHKEGGLWHWQPDLAREDEKLERHPCADGVGPDDVRDPVVQLFVTHGKKLWSQRVCRCVLLVLEHLVTTWEVQGYNLHSLCFLRPRDKGRTRTGVN
mmetsp:Transcript_118809/g.361418  ORF Transcript_118809/g.361418 Transcript_118809/m.361418 type:complete len:265 (+) Transcript_118809:3-797(+)